jgi:hypothetical protein
MINKKIENKIKVIHRSIRMFEFLTNMKRIHKIQKIFNEMMN